MHEEAEKAKTGEAECARRRGSPVACTSGDGWMLGANLPGPLWSGIEVLSWFPRVDTESGERDVSDIIPVFYLFSLDVICWCAVDVVIVQIHNLL